MSTEPTMPPDADPALQDDARARAAEPHEAGLPDLPDHEAEIAQLTAERDDMRDRWIRAEAEMANVRAGDRHQAA